MHFHISPTFFDRRKPQKTLNMAKKRQSNSTKIERIEQEESRHSKNLAYYDNWIWSKRHRSQEVMLTDTYRKGMHPTFSATFIIFVSNAISSLWFKLFDFEFMLMCKGVPIWRVVATFFLERNIIEKLVWLMFS